MRTLICMVVGTILFSVVAESGFTQTPSDYALIKRKIYDTPEIWEITKSLTNSEFGVDLFNYPRSGVWSLYHPRHGSKIAGVWRGCELPAGLIVRFPSFFTVKSGLVSGCRVRT